MLNDQSSTDTLLVSVFSICHIIVKCICHCLSYEISLFALFVKSGCS